MEKTKQESMDSISSGTHSDHPPMIQVFVFQGQECLGWDCFCKEQISIGSGQDVDLLLNGRSIAEIHAILSVDNGRIKASFYRSGSENDTPQHNLDTMILGPLDSLVIGPYTLKAKLNGNGKRIIESAKALNETTQGHQTSDRGPEQMRENVHPGNEQHQAPVPTHEIQGDADTSHSPTGVDVDVRQDGTCQYNLTFEGRIRDNISLEEVKKNLRLLFKKDERYIEKLFSGKKAILKRNADYQTLRHLQTMFENTGALCSIEPSIDLGLSVHKDSVPDPKEIERVQSQPQVQEDRPQKTECESPDLSVRRKTPVIDEEEDEEEAQATFSLKDKIRNYNAPSTTVRSSGIHREALLEIVKSRDDAIFDVRFLRSQEKYFIQTDHGLFCLAENKGGGEIFLYLNDQITGEVKSIHSADREDGRITIRESLLLERPRDIRHRKLSDHEVAVIHMGSYEYLLRQATPSESPQVKKTLKKDKEYVRHFGKSVIVHVIFFVILGMMPTYKIEPLPLEKDRFVQVDTKQLDEIMKTGKAKLPEQPKKAPEVIKVKDDQVAQRIEKRLVTATADRRAVTARSASSKVASSQPSTQGGGGGSGSGGGGGGGSGGGGGGGGSGPGNVVTKNVHQAGILSMIGDNIGLKPQEAMAAVTNLDAVSSPAENKAQFKVGGIVGKLDGGRIEIPKAGIVNTKGSSQVLRTGGTGGVGGTGTGGSGGSGGSGGPGGPGGGGWVASLDKGATGTHQVKAKVTAQLNKTVKIQGGGMSREEVKRIIDQHLDEITHCYEVALVANPSLMGRVVFEWKIMLSGKVGEVRIKSSTINSSDIHSCIQSAIRSWEFPQPENSEVIVSYPFIFDIVGF